ncbi:MAG: BON domain-containing protein [Pirellulaceae bacterium]
MANTIIDDPLDRARSALAASPIYLLRQLDINQVDGALYLSGRVDSFYHKQLAQEVVRAVSGTLRVVNSVRVEG